MGDNKFTRRLFTIGTFSVTTIAGKRSQGPEKPNLPTLWIIGDSTVRNGQGNGANNQWGWGDLLGPYFE